MSVVAVGLGVCMWRTHLSCGGAGRVVSRVAVWCRGVQFSTGIDRVVLSSELKVFLFYTVIIKFREPSFNANGARRGHFRLSALLS